MRLTIYVDQVDSHVHLRLFVNGHLAGKLVLREEEYIPFWALLKAGETVRKPYVKIEFNDSLFWEGEEERR